MRIEDGGTKELMRRRDRLTRSKDYPSTPFGILAGRQLITDVEYAAAIDFRDLWIANYGSPWPKAAAVESGGHGGLPASVPFPSGAQTRRLAFIIERVREYSWTRLVRMAVQEADFDDIITEVLKCDVVGNAMLSGKLDVFIEALRRDLRVVDSAPR